MSNTIEESAVARAIEYLDFHLAKNEPATLRGMLGHVDGYEKLALTLDEVNEALRRRPNIYIQRTNGGVEFAETGSEQSITTEDLKHGFAEYREEFRAWSKKQQTKKDSGN